MTDRVALLQISLFLGWHVNQELTEAPCVGCSPPARLTLVPISSLPSLPRGARPSMQTAWHLQLMGVLLLGIVGRQAGSRGAQNQGVCQA